MMKVSDTSFPNIPSDFSINTNPEVNDKDFFLAIYNRTELQVITGKYANLLEQLNLQKIKEGLYVTAIDNLIKKNEYLQLTIQFDQELISEEEFDKELTDNESRYLITMNPNFSKSDFEMINEIVPKLNRHFTSDEISELFSVPIESVNNYINSLGLNSEY